MEFDKPDSQEVIYIDEPSPWDPAERRTYRIFENLGLAIADLLYLLPGPDRADATAVLATDFGDKIKHALINGRTPDGFLTRYFERQAIGISFKKANAHKAKPEILDHIVDNEINEYFHEFGLQTPELSPYEK